MKLLVVAALAAAALLPSAASAVVLNYSIYGGAGPADTGFYRFRFQLDTTRTPSFLTPSVIRFAPTEIEYFLPGSSTPIVGTQSNLGPSFFPLLDQGGISILRLAQGNDPQPRFFGPALFTGTTASPTFLTGLFAVSTMPKNVPADVQIFDYRVFVNAPVPEPATWGLMVAGFGIVGSAARRRRRTAVAA